MRITSTSGSGPSRKLPLWNRIRAATGLRDTYASNTDRTAGRSKPTPEGWGLASAI
jgi:hypothetical protein